MGEMPQALIVMAVSEVMLGVTGLMELFTARRAVMKTFLHWQWLKTRHQCRDNVMMRFKYKQMDTHWYHEKFWVLIDQKLSPILLRIPQITPLVNGVKKWYCG